MKELKGGNHATVFLNKETKQVYKTYNDPFSSDYRHEKTILEHLLKLNCPFVPQLLEANDCQGKLVMTYVGKPAPKTKKNYALLKVLRKELKEKYHLVQKKPKLIKKAFQLWREPKTIHNVLIGEDGSLFFIDFGSKTWILL
jgi:hypothetical protein